jgi:pimeloyl-ACP methyl ester carboxylesterase
MMVATRRRRRRRRRSTIHPTIKQITGRGVVDGDDYDVADEGSGHDNNDDNDNVDDDNLLPRIGKRNDVCDEKKEEGADVDVDDGMKKQTLVLFSHGLTGTGEENSIFCAALAKRGYVVAWIHHRDRSSNEAPLHDGGNLYYKHFLSNDDFYPRDRLRQVNVRAKEMLQCRSWLVGGRGTGTGTPVDSDETEHRRIVLDQIRPHLDYEGDNAIAAGFSYGSTTAALAATLEPDKFKCTNIG